MSYNILPNESIDKDSENDHADPPRTAQRLKDLATYKVLFFFMLATWLGTVCTWAWLQYNGAAKCETRPRTNGPPFLSAPRRGVMFQSDSRFHYTNANQGNSSWESLFPAGNGIITVEQPETYNLSPSYPDQHRNSTTKAEVYSISMFHQLHCLASIRTQFGTLAGYFNKDSNNTLTRRRVFRHESHIDHCFDYLRQSIMCAGDLSLEPSVVPDEFGFNGWGAAHQCADWRVMWDAAVVHRYMYDADEEM